MLDVFFKNFFKQSENEELKWIKACPLFSKLTSSELSFLKKLLHKRLYTKGEVVFKPGVGTGMYIILKGQVHILHGDLNSQEDPSLVSSLKKGDFFGELALINSEAYQNIFAQSSENCQLLALYQADLDFILENKIKMGTKILKELNLILIHRLAKAEQKILQAHNS